ncbi:hypothetical protein [uncultured Alsobacter sp.]|uniref:hypothetical protein n=1 Tax=uncultured Alsobacter sp. TaxID=1748258 RepID=UPI0025F359F0|nr:hypothetical protein [uncultured Alsobacter sp.]
MVLRVRPDPVGMAVGMEPLSERALAWVESSVIPIGGRWGTVNGVIAVWLRVSDIPIDLLGFSGLRLQFGSAEPGPTIRNASQVFGCIEVEDACADAPCCFCTCGKCVGAG